MEQEAADLQTGGAKAKCKMLTCLSQKVPQESQPSASCGHRARDVAKALLAASLSSTAASS